MKLRHILFLSAIVTTNGCSHKSPDNSHLMDPIAEEKNDSLPVPHATKSVKNFCTVMGWPTNKTPIAPAGFIVIKYADKLKNPRWLYVTPNGDVLVAEANSITEGLKKVVDKVTGKSKSENTFASANQITILRDENKDDIPEIRQVFLANLNQPFGMLAIGNSFYVANTDGVMQYPYQPGQTQIKSSGKKILDLPAGGYNNHWTRNIITNADKTKIYVSIGSGSNDAEHGMANEIRRANILEVNTDGSGEKIFGSGLRNPVGMGWAPGTNNLWTVVNERDELGDNLVPDYLTHVKLGSFYGWPYAYIGPHEDPDFKVKNPEMVKLSEVPDVLLGAHTAALGLAFYDRKSFPSKYYGGAFIGEHGSWNRSELSGYKVVFVPFKNGHPNGKPEDFLTGFIADKAKSKVYGRPVGIAVLPDGALLIADDASNTIWKVKALNASQ